MLKLRAFLSFLTLLSTFIEYGVSIPTPDSTTSAPTQVLVARTGKGKEKAPAEPQYLPVPPVTMSPYPKNSKKDEDKGWYWGPKQDKGYGPVTKTVATTLARRGFDQLEAAYINSNPRIRTAFADLKVACHYWAPEKQGAYGYFTLSTQAFQGYTPDLSRAQIYEWVTINKLGNKLPAYWHAEPLAAIRAESKIPHEVPAHHTHPVGSFVVIDGRHGTAAPTNRISPCGEYPTIDPSCENSMYYLGIQTGNYANPRVTTPEPVRTPPNQAEIDYSNYQQQSPEGYPGDRTTYEDHDYGY